MKTVIIRLKLNEQKLLAELKAKYRIKTSSKLFLYCLKSHYEEGKNNPAENNVKKIDSEYIIDRLLGLANGEDIEEGVVTFDNLLMDELGDEADS